jgi:hypothetical protein
MVVDTVTPRTKLPFAEAGFALRTDINTALHYRSVAPGE